MPLDGAIVLDIGAGTGAASRAAARRGARSVALDIALGMLLADAAPRPPAVVGDAGALPFADGAFDASIAAFSLNHLDRSCRLDCARRRAWFAAGGAVVASAYAADDHHPVKDAVDAAAARRGWTPPLWYRTLKLDTIPRLATLDRAESVATSAGLDATVEAVHVAFPDLDGDDLVAWRMGLAQLAPFVATLPADERTAMAAEARGALGKDPAELERSLIVVVCVRR